LKALASLAEGALEPETVVYAYLAEDNAIYQGRWRAPSHLAEGVKMQVEQLSA